MKPWILVATILLALPGVGRAEDQGAVQKIEQLNRSAMDDYDILEFESARRSLDEALKMVKQTGLEKHAVAARTHMDLAVVLALGLGDVNNATMSMVSALAIDPTIKLDKAYKAPALQRVYEDAKAAVAQLGTPSAAATPASGSGSGSGSGGPPAQAHDDQDPLAGVTEVKGAEISAGSASNRPRFFLAIGAGSSGSFVTGVTEKRVEAISCCVAFELVNLKPEVGFWVSPQVAVSVYGRIGMPLDANVAGAAKVAPAALARVAYALDPEADDGVTFHGELGAGVTRQTIILTMPDETGATKDTHASGPLLVGGGLAWTKSLGRAVRFFVDSTAILGIPVVTAIGTTKPQWGLGVDLNLGVATAF